MASNRNRRGHTLLEIAVTSGVLLVIGGSVLALATESQEAFTAQVRTDRQTRESTDALEFMRDELESADPDTLSIDTSGREGDVIQLKCALALSNGVITWGARTVLGSAKVEDVGALVEYRLVREKDDECDCANGSCDGDTELQLVRRVVDGNGTELQQELLIVDDVDEPDDKRGGKAFTVCQSDQILTIVVRVRDSVDDEREDEGSDLIETRKATVRLRNQ